MSRETPNSEKFDVQPFLYKLPGFVLDGLLIFPFTIKEVHWDLFEISVEICFENVYGVIISCFFKQIIPIVFCNR